MRKFRANGWCRLSAACIATLIATGTANAQTNTPASSASNPSATAASSSASGWNVSKIIGANIKNSAGETIGSVNEILMDDSGKAQSAVVGVGGFLGIGEHTVAIAFSDLKMMRDANGAITVSAPVTKETLRSMPEWKDPNKPQANAPAPSSPATRPTGSTSK